MSDYMFMTSWAGMMLALVDEDLATGSYSVHFDASNLPSGVYYYRLLTDNTYSLTRKMMLIR